ncbi:hypothetical protein Tco_1017186 [Tanacetum coccineum]|uniref:Hydrophobic seed protein domain-containing protein n=1 Tax=Tanacetum coccineum TaxID=301880 RepID=A0ABQ5FQS4_9ASTR
MTANSLLCSLCAGPLPNGVPAVPVSRLPIPVNGCDLSLPPMVCIQESLEVKHCLLRLSIYAISDSLNIAVTVVQQCGMVIVVVLEAWYLGSGEDHGESGDDGGVDIARSMATSASDHNGVGTGVGIEILAVTRYAGCGW